MFKGRNKSGQELQIPFAWPLFSNRHNDGFLTEGGPLYIPSAGSVPSSSEIAQSEESWDDTFRCWSQGEMELVQTIDALVVAQKQLCTNPFPKICTLGVPGLANTRCNAREDN